MSYNTTADLAYDMSLQRRVIACAALEGITDPVQWAVNHAWPLAAQPGWGEAYAYAKAGETPNPDPGKDEGVITDGMILAAVQSLKETP